jgi:quinoprotein glucose dehydrogenase
MCFLSKKKPVPSSDVQGEEASKTQPFPTQLPLLGLRKVTTEDAWGPTPELEKEAHDRISSHINKGVFTPPSLQGSMMTPSNVGGMNWSGASYDPQRNLLVTNVNRMAALITLFPKSEHTRASVNTALPRAEVAQQEGTPYIMSREYLFTIVNGQVCNADKATVGHISRRSI